MALPGRTYRLDKDGYVEVEEVILPSPIINTDGAIVRYIPEFFDSNQATSLFNSIKKYSIDSTAAQGYMHGKYITTKRKTLQISDPGIRPYKFTFSTASQTEPFTKYPIIDALRDVIYDKLGMVTNFCLVNFYTPDAKLGWHSDDEKDMVSGSTIVSISLGDTRRFRLRHLETKEATDLYLSSGSLLTMEKRCQKVFEHCIWDINQKEKHTIVHNLRINLTFRKMKKLE